MPWTQVFRTLGQGGACLFRRRAEAILGGTRTRPLKLTYRLTAHSAQAASERSMFTVCEQPLLPPACSVAWSPLGLRLWVRALFLRKRRVFTPPPPLPLSAFFCAAERRRGFFLAWGTPWTRVFRRAGHPPAHQRFGRGDENYLVGEPVYRDAYIANSC